MWQKRKFENRGTTNLRHNILFRRLRIKSNKTSFLKVTSLRLRAKNYLPTYVEPYCDSHNYSDSCLYTYSNSHTDDGVVFLSKAFRVKPLPRLTRNQ